ncbi:unnamed protein product [Ectocarpus sp. 12 AP-2014]
MEHDGAQVPVYFMLQNQTKLKLFRDKILPVIADVCGRVQGGNVINVIIGNDEGDLLVKSENDSAQIEKLWKKPVLGNPSLYAAASIISYFTATPAAFHVNGWRLQGKTLGVRILEPSSNYWAYDSGIDRIEGTPFSTRATKVITREIGDLDDMMRYWNSSADRRAAVVMQTTETATDHRENKASETAIDYADMTGLVTCSWSAGVIDAFTSDESMLEAFNGAEDALFTKTTLQDGVFQYTGNTRNSVCSYPSLVTWLHDTLAESGVETVTKIVLFAKAKANRGVSIKGENHEWPLTDLLFEMSKAHGEVQLQAAGRLNGLDLSTATRKLWATESMHQQHQQAMRIIQLIVERLRDGDTSTSVENLQKHLETIEEAVEDTEVEDGFGSYCSLGAGGVTRADVERAHKRAFHAVTAAAKRRRITIKETSAEGEDPAEEPSAEPVVQPTVQLPALEPGSESVEEPAVEPALLPALDPVVEPAMLPALDPVVAPAMLPALEPVVEPAMLPALEPAVEPALLPAPAPVVEPEGGAEPDMSTQLFVENHEGGLTTVIREVIKNFPQGVDVAKAAEEAAMHEDYPDMDNHTPLKVMRCIVAKHDLTILAAANVVEMSGKLFAWV